MKKNLWVKLGAGLAALSLLSACGGGAKADSNEDSGNHGEDKIKSAGVLKVGTEAQYAPYEFKDADAKIVGADIALAQKIADDLGVKLEVVDMKFEGIIPAVQSGQVDLGIAAFSNTPERAKEVDFSNIYDKSEQMLVVDAQNKDKYTSVDALSGLKVGAQKGTIQSNLITKELTKSTLFELDKFSPRSAKRQHRRSGGGCLRGQEPDFRFLWQTGRRELHLHFRGRESGQGSCYQEGQLRFGRRGEQVRGRLCFRWIVG